MSENGCGANTPTPSCTSVGANGSQHTVLTPKLTWAPRNAAAEVDTDDDGVFDTRPGLRSVKVWIPMNQTEPGSSGSYTDAHVTLRGMGEPATIIPTTTQTICAPSMEVSTDANYDAYCANLESYVLTLDLTDNADGHRIPAVSCPSGTWGETCQNTCLGGSGADACNGKGTCADGPDGDGTCTCNAGYEGAACETVLIGQSAGAAGASCLALKDAGVDDDGTYWIDPDGIGSGDAPFQILCDMTTDGGGWSIVGRGIGGANSGWNTQNAVNAGAYASATQT